MFPDNKKDLYNFIQTIVCLVQTRGEILMEKRGNYPILFGSHEKDIKQKNIRTLIDGL